MFRFIKKLIGMKKSDIEVMEELLDERMREALELREEKIRFSRRTSS